MKTILSLIFVFGAVTSSSSYGYVRSPYHHRRQYSHYSPSYSRTYSPSYSSSYSSSYSPRVTKPFLSKTSLPADSNPADSSHPGTAAALAYISKNFNLDSCGQQAKTFIDSVLAGNSRLVASQAAAAVYQQNYAAGVPTSPACQAAEVAWKNAVFRGQDPVLPSALAYIEAEPSDSPCYVSAKEYIQATVAGGSQTEANLAAVKGFAAQISNLSKQGRTSVDGACLAAAQAYTASSEIPSAPTAAAMTAFIQRALVTGTTGYDPVCAEAGEAYIEAFVGGASEEEAIEAAAIAFLSAVDDSPDFNMDSHCGKAAQAFMANF